ncbi:MAG TPA: ATP-binding protein [Gemmatimonadaceae bacterium]|nr:ATP-binding protein [Gemmatimonadaceae bacterium]
MPPANSADDSAGASAPAAERRAGERRSMRRSNQAVLRQIVERLADGIVVVSADGCIRFANPAAERLFDRPAEELVGQEFGYPLSSAEPTEIEIVRRGSSVVVAELRLVDAAWEEEPAMLVSLRDVTDRKQAEERERLLEDERRARAEAEAANQAKSDFLAVMSHELRTPLNAVLGYAELLDLGVAGTLSAEQRQQVGRISASGRHLLGLVNEILDLAKVEAGRMSVQQVPTSVAEVVEAAIVLSQPQAEARGLTLSAPSEVPRALQLLGDHDRVLQILANLLSNAVKFTDPGGDIRIEVAEEADHAATRHRHGEGPWVVIRVRDSGIGIGPSQLDSIFAPFVQAEAGHTRRSDGTGLGLTISRRLARLMHGDVTVESTVGEGSIFTLSLPAVAPGTRAAGEQPVPSPNEETARAARTRGLAEIGDSLMHEMEAILDAFVAQLRREPLMPAAPTLRYSQLVDHSGALLADVASALITLDESHGAPSALLLDSADIQRFIADRHGLQRARLGWTSAALAREGEVLCTEIERSVRRCFGDPRYAAQVDEALGVICRYLEQGAETSRRALERALHQSARRSD